MICGYPIWVVLLIGAGVFCAAFMDAIGGGGGIISLPSYLLAGMPTHFALGTNKLSSSLGTIASAYRYVRSTVQTEYPSIMTVPSFSKNQLTVYGNRAKKSTYSTGPRLHFSLEVLY